MLVGTFDRPNLAYRVLPRVRLVPQVLEILSRHERRRRSFTRSAARMRSRWRRACRPRGSRRRRTTRGWTRGCGRGSRMISGSSGSTSWWRRWRSGWGLAERRALRDPRRDAQERRGVSAGDGACGARWAGRRVCDVVFGGGHHAVEARDRVRGRGSRRRAPAVCRGADAAHERDAAAVHGDPVSSPGVVGVLRAGVRAAGWGRSRVRRV